MKAFTSPRLPSLAKPTALLALTALCGATFSACDSETSATGSTTSTSTEAAGLAAIDPATFTVESPANIAKPPFDFAAEDSALLDEIQEATFGFLWEGVDPVTGMVLDRSAATTISVAGVGFQLSAFPIAVERGWVTRAEAEARANQILDALIAEPTNRKHGLFYHFLHSGSAAPKRIGEELVVSTIDTALLFAGMLTAGAYFEGDVRAKSDALIDAADWSKFVLNDNSAGSGFVSLGWRPNDDENPTGEGFLIPYVWIDSGDEHRLVTIIGMTPTNTEQALDPMLYWQLRRQVGGYDGVEPFVWFPWSGALFTKLFAHCWVDYASMGVDNPAEHGVSARVGVDWWENSRRAVQLHQIKAEENPLGLPGFGEHGWGLTASDVPDGYGVPGVFPDMLPVKGALPEIDYATYMPEDDFGDGTIAPYGAGSAIMFDPARAVAALRYSRELTDDEGAPLVWRDPAEGGFGFLDSYNLHKDWIAHEYVAIDQGPMFLAIENARTGLVWQLFHAHPWVDRALDRIGLEQPTRPEFNAEN